MVRGEFFVLFFQVEVATWTNDIRSIVYHFQDQLSVKVTAAVDWSSKKVTRGISWES